MNVRVTRMREWSIRLLAPRMHQSEHDVRLEHSHVGRRSLLRIHGWTSLTVALSLAAAPATYGLLETLCLLPPALRDRPWPLELAALVLAAVPARTWVRRRSRSGAALPSAARATALVAGVIALGLFARVYHHRLPAAPPELLARAILPAFRVHDSSGRPVTNSSLAGSPTVIVVYRGAWCAYCRKQLAVLADEARRFAGTPVKVVAVSPDSPARLVQLERSLNLPYTLLSDTEQNLAGLCVSSSHCVLVTDAQGTLRWGGFTDNWREPPRYAAILQAAYRLAN
jgi:peroxiredoxin